MPADRTYAGESGFGGGGTVEEMFAHWWGPVLLGTAPPSLVDRRALGDVILHKPPLIPYDYSDSEDESSGAEGSDDSQKTLVERPYRAKRPRRRANATSEAAVHSQPRTAFPEAVSGSPQTGPPEAVHSQPLTNPPEAVHSQPQTASPEAVQGLVDSLSEINLSELSSIETAIPPSLEVVASPGPGSTEIVQVTGTDELKGKGKAVDIGPRLPHQGFQKECCYKCKEVYYGFQLFKFEDCVHSWCRTCTLKMIREAFEQQTPDTFTWPLPVCCSTSREAGLNLFRFPTITKFLGDLGNRRWLHYQSILYDQGLLPEQVAWFKNLGKRDREKEQRRQEEQRERRRQAEKRQREHERQNRGKG
ncbi:hypothetical protein B0H67DRAFT_149651 [Lasiosphaeris hirsuta]|uniref:Uncharacterized protein n=1 Tax=Lasiosphaeris hirsuta TaxID=260670 RepID=A0AA40ANU0_9PEZI|nr:hypothetical protein B0H67DRAFT_149651 [Lasiosphaeris hirsuta]